MVICVVKTAVLAGAASHDEKVSEIDLKLHLDNGRMARHVLEMGCILRGVIFLYIIVTFG